MNIDEALNNLSPEEIDTLNSDPQLLQEFKTKFGGPPAEAREYETVPGMKPGEYPPETYTSAPNLDIVSLATQAPAIAKTAKLLPSTARSIAEASQGIPEVLSSMPGKIKSLLPNPSLKALGGIPTGVSEEMAQAARAYGTTAQPELAQALGKVGEEAAGKELVPIAESQAGDIAALEPKAQATIFKQPIIQGAARPPKEMFALAEEQNKQIGEGINNFLVGLEKTGSKFDPKPVIKQAESMLIRDVNGEIMTSGVQGETNSAIRDALSSLKDYSKGKPINWTDTNKIKTLLQKSASYSAKRFDESNEAYKQVASLIREGIDDQAANVLKQTGGDIQQFQNLRSAFGKTAVLRQMLEKSSRKAALQPSTAEHVMGALKSSWPWMAKAAGVGTVYETFKHLF